MSFIMDMEKSDETHDQMVKDMCVFVVNDTNITCS